MTLPPPAVPESLEDAPVAFLVRAVLKVYDSALSEGQEGELLIYGSAAAAIYLAETHPEFRPTDDIDVDELAATLNIDAWLEISASSLTQWAVPPGFRDSTVDVTDLMATERLEVLLVHPYDLVILKMGRWEARDYEDCAKLVDAGLVTNTRAFERRLEQAWECAKPRCSFFDNFRYAYNDLFDEKLPFSK